MKVKLEDVLEAMVAIDVEEKGKIVLLFNISI